MTTYYLCDMLIFIQFASKNVWASAKILGVATNNSNKKGAQVQFLLHRPTLYQNTHTHARARAHTHTHSFQTSSLKPVRSVCYTRVSGTRGVLLNFINPRTNIAALSAKKISVMGLTRKVLGLGVLGLKYHVLGLKLVLHVDIWISDI